MGGRRQASAQPLPGPIDLDGPKGPEGNSISSLAQTVAGEQLAAVEVW